MHPPLTRITDDGMISLASSQKGLDMIAIPLAQAKNQLSELIARVEHGESIEVTRRGKSVAKLVPVDEIKAEDQGARVQAALDWFSEFRKGLALDGDIKAIAREGLD